VKMIAVPPPQTDRFEQSTALTDAVIAAVALAGARRIAVSHQRDRFRAVLWSSALSTLAVSALLGAVVHGFLWSAHARSRIWRGLNLLLSMTVGLFAVAALHDCSGRRPALRLLPWTVLAAFGFEAAAHRFRQGFGALLAYEAAALGAALIGYSASAARGRVAGSGRIALGLALSLAAAAVQRSTLRIDLPWLALDRNGLFHLVQIAGLVPLIDGVCAAPRESA
jgi:hypothetical protein